MTAPAARILVIEDNALLRTQLQRLFADAGMAVEFASDGLAGLQMALDAPPDVLVLDVGLPGLNGLHLCERLRTLADRHVPVLMLTARDALEDKLQGFRAGADDYLVKPFASQELDARLRNIIRRARKTFLVCDHSKIDRSAPARLASLSELTCFFTDLPLPEELDRKCRDWGVQVVVAGS